MVGTKLEVEDLLLRYRDYNGNNDKETKTTKELALSRAIIVLDEFGNEREIMFSKNETSEMLPKTIEVVSMLYIESKTE